MQQHYTFPPNPSTQLAAVRDFVDALGKRDFDAIDGLLAQTHTFKHVDLPTFSVQGRGNWIIELKASLENVNVWSLELHDVCDAGNKIWTYVTTTRQKIPEASIGINETLWVFEFVEEEGKAKVGELAELRQSRSVEPR